MGIKAELKQQYYTRFGRAERMEHFALLVSFSMLAVTGLPQRYAEYQLAKDFIEILGGIESVRILHRFFAVLLMATAIYHGGAVSYKVYVRGVRLSMIPSLRDVRDALGVFLYNIGLRKEHPKMPRYNFGEKVEYLAVVWGTLVMIVTGFMMWNPVATAEYLPGVVIPAARAAHSFEALLAVLSILIWHMYNVHLKRFNRAMFTGKLPRDAMQEEHAEELAEIESGADRFEIPPDIIAKRRRRFFPYAVLMSALLVGGLIWFVTLEKSAIDTVPRREIAVFAPQVTPEVGDAALGKVIWQTSRCAFCHGSNAQGQLNVPALRDTRVTFEEFYQQVRIGGERMPAFTPEEIPDGYLFHVWTWLTSPPTP